MKLEYIVQLLEEVKPLKEELLINPNTLVEGNIIPNHIIKEREEVKKKSTQLTNNLQQYLTKQDYTKYTAKQLTSMYASENLGADYVKKLLKEDSTMGAIPKKYQKLLSKPNTDDKQVNKFKKLKQLKAEILKKEQETTKTFDSYNSQIQDIYHIIESEKMGASDMYNVMKALQYQVKKSRELEKHNALETLKKEFERLGGMREYTALKNYLTDKGVNVHELN